MKNAEKTLSPVMDKENKTMKEVTNMEKILTSKTYKEQQEGGTSDFSTMLQIPTKILISLTTGLAVKVAERSFLTALLVLMAGTLYILFGVPRILGIHDHMFINRKKKRMRLTSRR